jgi:CRP/FNR family cyclic AMP-dependent transcriptional regulator
VVNPSKKDLVTLIQLQSIALLEGIDTTYLTQLSEQMRQHYYESKQTVLRKGAAANELMFLFSGQLQVVDTSIDGKDVGLHLVEPNDVFGHMALLDGLVRSTSVIATQTSQVFGLSKTLAIKLFYDHPIIMHRLLIEFSGIIRNTNNARSVLTQSHAAPRVFSILANLMRPNIAGLITIEKMPRQQELAIMANTSRETISRAIGLLIQKEIVEKDLRRLIIRKPDFLLRLADESCDD